MGRRRLRRKEDRRVRNVLGLDKRVGILVRESFATHPRDRRIRQDDVAANALVEILGNQRLGKPHDAVFSRRHRPNDCGVPRHRAPEEMLMMQPLPCSSIDGNAYLVQRKSPRRLTFMTRSQSSTGSS